MAREIKFRAWDKEKGIMYEPKEINELIKRLDGQEFTGLHDKNGKEIYEGDVVEFHGNYTIAVKCGWKKGTIVWDINLCGWMIEVSGLPRYTMEETDEFYAKTEVIGNIYENKELIKN